jgi:hypothetical protein
MMLRLAILLLAQATPPAEPAGEMPAGASIYSRQRAGPASRRSRARSSRRGAT